jgi:hypothetical protein
MQEFASRPAEKVRASVAGGDDSDAERAEQIDKTARQARYGLMVMHGIWDERIEKAADIHQREQKISARSKVVLQTVISIHKDARAISDRLEQIRLEIDSFSRNGIPESYVKAASALLAAVDDELPSRIKRIHERSQEIQPSIQKLQVLALKRERLNEDARQATEIAAQAAQSIGQALESLQGLSNACQPLRSLLRKMEECREAQTEPLRDTRHKSRGMGR